MRRVPSWWKALRRSRYFFRRLKRETGGMMRSRTYKRLYEAALSAPPGSHVEIGAAHGASTIAQALAIRDTSRLERIHVFDKGLVRGQQGRDAAEEGHRILMRNLESWGVADTIVLHPVNLDPGRTDLAAQVPRPVGMLVIDADGELWRDFGLFYEMLAPGAAVVLDDYVSGLTADSLALDHSVRTRKAFRVTAYADYLIAEGLLDPARPEPKTFFGRRPMNVDTARARSVLETMAATVRARVDGAIQRYRAPADSGLVEVAKTAKILFLLGLEFSLELVG